MTDNPHFRLVAILEANEEALYRTAETLQETLECHMWRTPNHVGVFTSSKATRPGQSLTVSSTVNSLKPCCIHARMVGVRRLWGKTMQIINGGWSGADTAHRPD
jgi:hypothetical protein